MQPVARRGDSSPPQEVQPCGECYACCVWLGIAELKKPPGMSCKHLNGANPCARCSIYESRPSACAEYRCVWKASDLPLEYRPDQSGALVTRYSNGFTIWLTDPDKAGDINSPDSKLNFILARLLDHYPAEEIRIANPRSKRLMLMKDGNIYLAQILKGDGIEDLKYAILGGSVGRYQNAERPES